MEALVGLIIMDDPFYEEFHLGVVLGNEADNPFGDYNSDTVHSPSDLGDDELNDSSLDDAEFSDHASDDEADHDLVYVKCLNAILGFNKRALLCIFLLTIVSGLFATILMGAFATLLSSELSRDFSSPLSQVPDFTIEIITEDELTTIQDSIFKAMNKLKCEQSSLARASIELQCEKLPRRHMEWWSTGVDTPDKFCNHLESTELAVMDIRSEEYANFSDELVRISMALDWIDFEMRRSILPVVLRHLNPALWLAPYRDFMRVRVERLIGALESYQAALESVESEGQCVTGRLNALWSQACLKTPASSPGRRGLENGLREFLYMQSLDTIMACGSAEHLLGRNKEFLEAVSRDAGWKIHHLIRTAQWILIDLNWGGQCGDISSRISSLIEQILAEMRKYSYYHVRG